MEWIAAMQQANTDMEDCHRWDMRQSRKQTMRFTSKKEEKV